LGKSVPSNWQTDLTSETANLRVRGDFVPGFSWL
jgi:hypothetical protein